MYSVLENTSAAEHRKETCRGCSLNDYVEVAVILVKFEALFGSFGAPLPGISFLAPTDTQADKAKKLCEIQMMKHRAPHTLLPISVCHCVTYLHSHSVSHWCEAVSLCQSFVLC